MNKLQDKGVLSISSTSVDTGMSQPQNLQKQRLFENLKYSVWEKMQSDILKREAKNPKFDKTESNLGLFIEKLEPQVRSAILILHKKGYSIDLSGFAGDPCEQMIEGDFQLEEKTIKQLNLIGVYVETNPSGYTRIYFLPEEANISKIKNKWDKIASLIPDKHRHASASMTRKARDFRLKYK